MIGCSDSMSEGIDSGRRATSSTEDALDELRPHYSPDLTPPKDSMPEGEGYNSLAKAPSGHI